MMGLATMGQGTAILLVMGKKDGIWPVLIAKKNAREKGAVNTHQYKEGNIMA